jgi:hypothetical protein
MIDHQKVDALLELLERLQEASERENAGTKDDDGKSQPDV